MSIGVFDSGVGGLTVYKELAKLMPSADLVYLGDTARVPYGNRSPSTIINYAIECADFLTGKHKLSALVVACNTISSYALEHLRSRYKIPVIGVIEAGVIKALSLTRNMRIGVIGTRGTVGSGTYESVLMKFSDSKAHIYQQACPLLVPLVEEGILQGEIAECVLNLYMKSFIKNGFDTLILGCTHYPLLKDTITSLYPDIFIADASSVLAKMIKDMDLIEGGTGERFIYVTDISPSFDLLKDMLVGSIPAQLVDIGCVHN